METQDFKIAVAQSSVDWIGRKVTGAHNGTIAIKEGNLTFNNSKLTGGSIIIDTRSINILDVTDPATNAQFAGHLASDDFFSTEKFPNALLEITSAKQLGASNYQIIAALTIKGITHAIEFALEILLNPDSLDASAKVIIDRTKYNMKFRSGNFFTNLGDTLIYNEFELNVNIHATVL